MKTYYKDPFLVRAIEAHKKIVTEGENLNLDSIGYEEGTPINHVYTYNAIMILGRLEFPHNGVPPTFRKFCTLSKFQPKKVDFLY